MTYRIVRVVKKHSDRTEWFSYLEKRKFFIFWSLIDAEGPLTDSEMVSGYSKILHWANLYNVPGERIKTYTLFSVN